MFGPARVSLLFAAALASCAAATSSAQKPSLLAYAECPADVAERYGEVTLFDLLPAQPVAGRSMLFPINTKRLADERAADGKATLVDDDLEVLDDAGNPLPGEPDEHELYGRSVRVETPAPGSKVRVRYTAVIQRSDGACRLTFVSSPIATRKSSVKVDQLETAWWTSSEDDSLRGAKLSFHRGFCGKERIRVRVWSGSLKASFTSRAGCAFGDSRVIADAGKLQLKLSDGGLLITLMKSGRVRFTVSAGGRQIGAGSFRVRYKVQPGRRAHRIYDTDFDNYFNICVSGNHRIQASGGRLYCYIKGRAPRQVSVIVQRRLRRLD